jgi:hypothetical protein
MLPHTKLALSCGLLFACVSCAEQGGSGTSVSTEPPPKVSYVTLSDVGTRKNSSVISIELAEGSGRSRARLSVVDSECGKTEGDFRPSDEQVEKAAELLNIQQLFKLDFLATWPDPGIACAGRAYDPATGKLVPAERCKHW